MFFSAFNYPAPGTLVRAEPVLPAFLRLVLKRTEPSVDERRPRVSSKGGNLPTNRAPTGQHKEPAPEWLTSS